MSWGAAFANAWDSATETAREVAKAAARGVRNAVNRARDIAEAVVDTALSAAQRAAALAATVGRRLVGIGGKIVDLAIGAFSSLLAFGRNVIGRVIEACPFAGGGGGAGGGSGGGSGGGASGGGDDEDDTDDDEDDDINIVSVDWLNGGDEIVIGDCEQFVNLPQDAKWLADSGIPNIDRLGIQPRFLVKFDKPKSAGFQWRLIKVAGGSPDYTGAEEGRNSDFKATPTDWTSGSVSEGKMIMKDKAKLVAGGGYKFKIEAKDVKGKVVKSGVITTKRLFWYVELPMTGLTTVLSSTATMDAEFAKYHMVLKQMPDLGIPHQENIGNNADKATLEGNIASALNGSAATKAKAPYLVKIAYTDHLAVKNPNVRQRKQNVDVGPGKGTVTMDIVAASLLPPNNVERKNLWHSIVTGESWFVDAVYTPDDGSGAVSIDTGDITPTSNYAVDIDLENLPAGRGTVDLFVNVVDRMRAGLALSGNANICICTRAWWRTESDADQIGVAIHEMGHIVDQCTTGTGDEPDASATQYTGSGHAGSHCHKGCASGQADYGTSANVSASQCVMFGTSNGKTAFCGNCAPGMYKVDIGGGF